MSQQHFVPINSAFFDDIHFIGAYDNMCNVAPARLKELNQENSDFSCWRVQSAQVQL